MTNPFRLEYTPFRNRLETALERKVVEGADLLVANTEHLRDEFGARFGERVRGKCVTIPNGFDPDELEGVTRGDNDRKRRIFRLTHTGFLYGKRDPRAVLDGIKLLQDRGVLQSGQLECELVGPIELSYDLGTYLHARRLDHLVIRRGPVSHAESLACLAACDVALLLQPGTDTQIPSKLFEYIGMGKPVLALARKGSAVASMVTEHGLGEVADAEDVEGIADAIHRSYRLWASGGTPAVPAEALTKFDIRSLAGTLAAAMDRLARERTGR
jgi:glycosyltransferase involved in cell wall biosynthesis